MIVELVFPVRGELVPADHAYALYGALSWAVPAFHEADSGLRFAPLAAGGAGRGMLNLGDASRLLVRLPSERIPDALPLAGKKLDLGGGSIRLGVPSVRGLVPSSSLLARLVTFKHAEEAEPFLESARKFLTEKGVGGEPSIPLIESGPHQGKPRRKVIRIKDKTVVGYSLLVEGLTAEESLKLQEEGLGGRTKMGCGFFVTVKGE